MSTRMDCDMRNAGVEISRENASLVQVCSSLWVQVTVKTTSCISLPLTGLITRAKIPIIKISD